MVRFGCLACLAVRDPSEGFGGCCAAGENRKLFDQTSSRNGRFCSDDAISNGLTMFRFQGPAGELFWLLSSDLDRRRDGMG